MSTHDNPLPNSSGENRADAALAPGAGSGRHDDFGELIDALDAEHGFSPPVRR